MARRKLTSRSGCTVCCNRHEASSVLGAWGHKPLKEANLLQDLRRVGVAGQHGQNILVEGHAENRSVQTEAGDALESPNQQFKRRGNSQTSPRARVGDVDPPIHLHGGRRPGPRRSSPTVPRPAHLTPTAMHAAAESPCSRAVRTAPR